MLNDLPGEGIDGKKFCHAELCVCTPVYIALPTDGKDVLMEA